MRKLLIGATILGSMLATTAMATDLRLGHWLPAQHPIQAGFEAWAAAAKEKSGGSLNFSFFPAAQLGAANDHYDMAKGGIVDLAWIAIGYTPGKFPVAEYLDVPFAFDVDPVVANKAINAWYAEFAEKEMPDVKLCFVHLMPAGYLHTKREIKAPEDAKGLRIRPASAAVSTYFTSLGNTSVPLPVTEAQQAMEKGVADAISLAYNSVNLYGIDANLKYHLDTPLYYPGGAVVMNKNTYARLTDTERAAIDQYCSGEGAVIASSGWHEWEAEGRSVMEAKGGHHFYVPSEIEHELWKANAKPVVDQWRQLVENAGHDADSLLDDLAEQIRLAQ